MVRTARLVVVLRYTVALTKRNETILLWSCAVVLQVFN